MRIHTIGDSHCCNGWKIIPNVFDHHLGAKLCYSIGRDGIIIKDNYGINNNDIVIFCFGEIDCRCHIHKHINESNSYTQIIDSIVEKYFEKIKIAVSDFENLKVCIYNVVPPVQKYNTPENSEYPYLGSDEERKMYVLYFNKKLKEKCKEYNYVFFDIYDNYADENGFLKKNSSDGNVHIRDPYHIFLFLKNNLYSF
jgi:hypothetical protein